MKLKVREYAVLPEDIYNAYLEGMEEIETQYGDAIKFTFVILGDEYEGTQVTGLASIPADGLTPKAKLRQWVEGIMGKKLAGYASEIDLESLLGMRCRLNLGIKETKDNTYNVIQGILPAPRKPAVQEDDSAPLF